MGFIKQHLKRFNFLFAAAALCSALTIPTLTAPPAWADLKVCNNTDTLVGLAVGYRLKGTWISEGWWQVPKDKCVSVIEGDLNARFYYLHAEDSKTGGRWQGKVSMCTSSQEFKIEGLKNCYSRGFARTGFFEVDTREQKSWQVRLTDNDANKKKAPSQ